MNSKVAIFLTGNSFPMSLIRRRVTIVPITLDDYRERLAAGGWASYWGHLNTLAVAKTVCGFDLTPKTPRPAVTLDADDYPMLDGISYRECLVFSPQYAPGFRPALGEEVQPESILGWQVLRICWDS